MTERITLYTSQDAFERLHGAVDKHRTSVKVDCEVLLHLLMDHSNMLGALKRSTSVIVTEPTPARRRERVRAKP